MTSWLFQSAGVYTQFFRIFSPRRDLARLLGLGLAQRMEGRRRPHRSDSSSELRSRPKFRFAAPFREVPLDRPLHPPWPRRKIPSPTTSSIIAIRQDGDSSRLPFMALKEVPGMPITKELTMRMDNRSGSLGKVCRSLADQGINILAFQSIPSERTILVCIVVDKPAAAEAVLEKERITYAEGEVVQVKIPHTPGELARAASKLGGANININYAYCGVEPSTNSPLVIFGVTEVGRAASILDQSVAAAAAM